ncbi:hypothetical protein, partial [Klebsiella pneumoniae]|uniref:hypothetical protein n=1 Tax=Klebsiella pneumoniae TaxID=573 RepID=UPI0019548596
DLRPANPQGMEEGVVLALCCAAHAGSSTLLQTSTLDRHRAVRKGWPQNPPSLARIALILGASRP